MTVVETREAYRKLKVWFIPTEKRLRNLYAPNSRPLIRIPILVEKAWMTQQMTINRLHKEIRKLKEAKNGRTTNDV